MNLNRNIWLRKLRISAFSLLVVVMTTGLAHSSEPIKVGALVPLSGGAGSYGPNMAKAAKVAAQYINEQTGGVLGGRQIKILVENTGSNPTTGVKAARKLIEANGVDFIVGVWNSSVAMAIKQIILNEAVLMMVGGSADQITEGETKNLIWRYQAKSSLWGPVIARAMLAAGFKQVSILGLQNPFTISMIKPFKQVIEANGGTVIDTVFYHPNQPSYRAEVLEVFGAEPEAVFIPAMLPGFVAIAKDVYRLGFDAPIYTLSIAAASEGDFVKAVGKDVAEGIHHFQPTPPTGTEAYKRFLELMGAPSGTLFLFAANTFDEVITLSLAIEKAGSTDPSMVAAALVQIANPPGKEVSDPAEAMAAIRAGKKINYTGAGSAVNFDTHGDLINPQFTHYVIHDGKNVVLGVVK